VLRHGLVVDVEPLGGTGAEVLDEDVRLFNQLVQRLLRVLVLQVQFEALLPVAQAPVVRRLALDERGSGVADGVAIAGLFDLDDLRALVRQHRRAEAAGDERREVENRDAL
jgi:hypothetical protein